MCRLQQRNISYTVINSPYRVYFLTSSLVSSVVFKFFTRFECGFQVPHSFRVWFSSCSLVSSVVFKLFTRFECGFSSFPSGSGLQMYNYVLKVDVLNAVYNPNTTGADSTVPPHWKMQTQAKYTRNEWRRCKTTLETSGEDVKLHSKRVEKTGSY